MSHPFEAIEKPYFKRLKNDLLLEGMSTKCSKVCQAVLKPAITPRAPHPRGKEIKPFVLPAHSRWFQYGKIHQIERLQFPEIDENPDFAKEYIEIRDKMVKLYRLYPTVELRITTVRHIHGGNLTLIQRIHSFLSIWGLINFQSYPHGDSDLTKEGALLKDEFSSLFEPKIINPPNFSLPRNSICCTLCKSECADGHFLSIKYPSIILCTKCFTNTQAFNQIGAQHAAFEFKTLYQPYPKNKTLHTENQRMMIEGLDKEKKFGDKYEAERKNSHPYDKYAIDWQQVAIEANKQQLPAQPQPTYSQLDCFLTTIRLREGDFTAPTTILNHEFRSSSKMQDLINFTQFDDASSFQEVEMPEHVDWDALDNEIDEISSLTRTVCNSN